jgi:hypothetical protein
MIQVELKHLLPQYDLFYFFVDKLLISTFKHEQNRKKGDRNFFSFRVFDDISTLKPRSNYVNGFYFSKIKGGLDTF